MCVAAAGAYTGGVEWNDFLLSCIAPTFVEALVSPTKRCLPHLALVPVADAARTVPLVEAPAGTTATATAPGRMGGCFSLVGTAIHRALSKEKAVFCADRVWRRPGEVRTCLPDWQDIVAATTSATTGVAVARPSAHALPLVDRRLSPYRLQLLSIGVRPLAKQHYLQWLSDSAWIDACSLPRAPFAFRLQVLQFLHQHSKGNHHTKTNIFFRSF